MPAVRSHQSTHARTRHRSLHTANRSTVSSSSALPSVSHSATSASRSRQKRQRRRSRAVMQSSSGPAERTVRVIWIRHGETADNARHIIQGHIDTPLDEMGIIQSQATRDLLKDTKIDLCFTSDLQRAKKTAEIILEDHPDTPLIVDERIKEKYLGLMEGELYYAKRTPEVLASIEPLDVFTKRLLSFWDDLFPPSTPYTNGSSSTDTASDDTEASTSSSSSSTSKKPLLPNEPKDLNVLVVTHGGPIKVAFTALPGERKHIVWEKETLKQAKEVKMKVWNCSLSEITMTKARAGPGQPLSGWVGVIHKFADIQHLMVEEAAPREGTEADADISNDTPAPSAAELAEAERRYHLDHATPWWQQTQENGENA